MKILHQTGLRFVNQSPIFTLIHAMGGERRPFHGRERPADHRGASAMDGVAQAGLAHQTSPDSSQIRKRTESPAHLAANGFKGSEQSPPDFGGFSFFG